MISLIRSGQSVSVIGSNTVQFESYMAVKRACVTGSVERLLTLETLLTVGN